MGLIRIPLPSLLLPQRRVTVRSEFNVKALINVGSGLMDLVSGKACTLTGAFQRTVGPSGWRLSTPAGGVSATSPTGLTSSQPITIVVMSTSTSGSSTNALSDSAGGWGVPKIECLSGVLTAMCRVSGGTNLSITGPTVPVGKTYTAALHWRSGIGLKVSFNGGDVQSAANSATALYATPAVLSIGSGSSNTVYFGAAILGTLSDDEIRVLSANPQALLADDDYWLWWPSAAAGSDVSASGGAVAGGSATAQASVALSALGGAVSSGSAGIQADVPLSAGGLAESSGSAGLSATVSISAAGMSESHGDAVPALDVSMSASGHAAAGGTASLSSLAAGALVADSRYLVSATRRNFTASRSRRSYSVRGRK